VAVEKLTGAEFKKQLRAGRPKMGLFLNSHSPTVAEQLAHSGYDWLLCLSIPSTALWALKNFPRCSAESQAVAQNRWSVSKANMTAAAFNKLWISEPMAF
jgi:hypothetical protein